MNKEELILLRELVNSEIKRRERIIELLNNDSVKEYLKLTKTSGFKVNASVLDTVLKDFSIKRTNGIYVCTSATKTEFSICYQETDAYSKKLPIDSKEAEQKRYIDIETGNIVVAINKENKFRPLISEFEKNKLVLNPYNTCEDLNGYNEVKKEFFENAIKYGQTKSKNMLLKKYKRL